ncbi:hypothetical protein Leryth_017861 [Lithospermum erythrorhizon]|nr:hypothetical protein Leryth_017861 [Lithospermum erythrorhizon]
MSAAMHKLIGNKRNKVSTVLILVLPNSSSSECSMPIGDLPFSRLSAIVVYYKSEGKAPNLSKGQEKADPPGASEHPYRRGSRTTLKPLLLYFGQDVRVLEYGK